VRSSADLVDLLDSRAVAAFALDFAERGAPAAALHDGAAVPGAALALAVAPVAAGVGARDRGSVHARPLGRVVAAQVAPGHGDGWLRGGWVNFGGYLMLFRLRRSGSGWRAVCGSTPAYLKRTECDGEVVAE
jgi:hypothetical protein